MSIFKGDVVRFPRKKSLKVPHMGWNQINKVGLAADLGIYRRIPDNAYFYFVHSYFPEPSDKKIAATTTDYGVRFVSSIASESLFACQFHPEKSGENGLRLLRNFVRSSFKSLS
jgi:glutamine amidotransferase